MSTKFRDFSVSGRFWEIDALRGIAFVLMSLFHIIFVLVYFGGWEINIHSGPLYWLGRISASLFLLLVGVSMYLKFLRLQSRGKGRGALFVAYARRAVLVFMSGMLITAMTSYLERGTIVFGVLHFIGVSMVLGVPFLYVRYPKIIIGTVWFMIGYWLQHTVRVTFYSLLWLGLIPDTFVSLDYYPIFPWFGVVLVGMWVGEYFYKNYTRQFSFTISRVEHFSFLIFLGKHALLLYLIHFPVIVFVLYFFGAIGFNIVL